MSSPLSTGLASRPARALRTARRALLRRRRPLAALCVAVAVVSGLAAVRPPAAATRSVLVATSDLPAGTRLAADDVSSAAWPVGRVPDGVLTTGAAVGQVLAAPVRAGEPLTDVRLVGPALTSGAPGEVALPLRLPDAGAVALLHAGDRIDLVGDDPQGGSARALADDVPVLAVPPPDGVAGADGTSGRLVVLGVPEGEAAELSEAAVTSVLTWTWPDR